MIALPPAVPREGPLKAPSWQPTFSAHVACCLLPPTAPNTLLAFAARLASLPTPYEGVGSEVAWGLGASPKVSPIHPTPSLLRRHYSAVSPPPTHALRNPRHIRRPPGFDPSVKAGTLPHSVPVREPRLFHRWYPLHPPPPSIPPPSAALHSPTHSLTSAHAASIECTEVWQIWQYPPPPLPTSCKPLMSA